ncbi:penicillin-binding protein activator [Agarivorans sp. 1_MG-2023]|uniref:penicillin-binding protein activator n=1 Tax=Agarivorans sp. 1_MG-2023 TaxID=3062634 RepID=UPI0026E1951A|nr:penicillin-binding protein activator [Agarivorans sp. 1_MG-2023]MDO6764565.1 penicillin-binding protein activator [Agarivorans sp. 1_MG-2023]
MKHNLISALRYISLSLVLILAACTSGPTKPPVVAIELPSIALAPEHNAEFYLDQASIAPVEQSFEWELLAAKAYYQQGMYQAGDAVTTSLSKQAATPKQAAGLRIVQAYAQQQQGNYTKALGILDFDPLWQLPDDYWFAYYLSRGDIYQQQNNPLAAAGAYIELDRYLAEESREGNHQNIWQQLKPLTAFTLRSFQQPGNELRNGWLEIVAISNEPKQSPEKLIATLQNWKTDYPEHPALDYVGGDLAKALSISPYAPKKIAVLLPLTGKYQSNALAVKDGLVSAFLDQQSEFYSDAELVFYDTQAQAMETLYPQLELDQIDFIVGPLLKSQLRSLVNLAPSMPVFALNDIQATENDAQFFFPLSPEDEAKQAAQFMAQREEQNPLILAPQSSLGTRMGEAFSEEWKLHSSSPVDVVFYANRNDLQRAVRKLLHTDTSQQRISQFKQIVGQDIEAEVRSRSDANSLYLVGTNTETKLIKAFIDVTVSPFAVSPRLYASSRSYDKNDETSENELDGIYISEMPWILEQQSVNSIRHQQLWPSSSDSQKRLYGLGYDAYSLINQLAQMRGYSEYQFKGLTGNLSVDQQGLVVRQLTWTQYKNGQLVPLEIQADTIQESTVQESNIQESPVE